MAVSSISSSSANLPNPNSVQSQFAALLKSINSGDLAGAQQAYSELSQNPAATKGPLGKALQQIGSALQSGDINGAQQTLASLQQQFAAHRGHHHHHGGQSSPPSDASTSSNAASLDPSVGQAVDKTA